MRKKTLKEVIADFKRVHGDRYDYSRVQYVNNRTKVEIICKEHGIFEQLPTHHKRGIGCRRCRSDTMTTPENTVILKCKKIHGSRYNYNDSVYLGQDKPFSFLCNNCCHTTTLSRTRLHVQGSHQGCDICSGNMPRKMNKELFLKRLFYRFPTREYGDFSSFIYSGNLVSGNITCENNHKFVTTPNRLFSGCWCPSCADFSFDKSSPATLYYLSVNNGKTFKIGITNRTVDKRFTAKDLKKIDIIKEWHFDDGETTYNLEQYILNFYKEFKYKGKNILSSGNTELFTKDVLGLTE